MKSLVGSLLNKAPVPYIGRATGPSHYLLRKNDAVAQMSAMGTGGTLFSIVHRLSNATAMVEWNLWRKAKSGLDEDRKRIDRHAALSLWLRPNPWMAGLEFRETTQQHIDLTGEGWWVIYRSGRSKLPLELWPVRPDRMTPVPDPKAFIKGYIYTSPDGEVVPLTPRDVIRMRMPNPLNPYRGMGAVQTILTDLEAGTFSAEWNRNFFINSAEPGGIIEVDRRLDDDEFDELRERWAEQHRGVAAAHRVALIEQGMKWVDRNVSQRDMQFIESRVANRDIIREAFGVPKFVLGDVDDVNRASARESSVFFNQYLVVPRLERLKSILNNYLLPLFGDGQAERLEFDYESPVPPDRQSDNEELAAQSEGAKALVDAGYEPAAVLEAVGLPDMEWVGPPVPPQPPANEKQEGEEEGPPAEKKSAEPEKAPAKSNSLVSWL